MKTKHDIETHIKYLKAQKRDAVPIYKKFLEARIDELEWVISK